MLLCSSISPHLKPPIFGKAALISHLSYMFSIYFKFTFCSGTEKVPQKTFATKMLPNFRVNFLVRFASKSLFYWVLPSNCSENYLVLFVRFFGFGVPFLALDLCSCYFVVSLLVALLPCLFSTSWICQSASSPFFRHSPNLYIISSFVCLLAFFTFNLACLSFFHHWYCSLSSPFPPISLLSTCHPTFNPHSVRREHPLNDTKRPGKGRKNLILGL